ncbi:hypothetical protein ACFLVS_06285 [Chloroflexota bacterium]
MATIRRNLFLYLALACFVGIIAIFIVDGYFGVYDTLYVTASEREEKIEADFWLRGDYPWSTGVNWDEKAFFRYEADNRRFSEYSTTMEVSVWRMQEKVLEVLSQPIEVAPFEKGQVEWALDTAELRPSDTPPEQPYEFSVIIKGGETERKVILYINPVPYPIKTPVPVR